MKQIVSFFSALAASLALHAAPAVSNVAVVPASDGAVQVNYDISEDAIVTVTFEQDGTLVPTNKTTLVAGDVNRVVTAGSRDYFWVLSRKPTMPKEQLDGILDRAKAWGFDLGELEYPAPVPDGK